MPNWREAGERYRQAAETRARELRNAESARSRYTEAEFVEGAADLARFMESSEWHDARELLAASKRHIVFGEVPDGHIGTVYFLSEDGPQQSVESMGLWMSYAALGRVSAPRCSPLTFIQAVHAAVEHGGKEPRKIVEWLRKELDRIAASAPNPE